MDSNFAKVCRVAMKPFQGSTAQGIWVLTFPDSENIGNVVNLIFTPGELEQHGENFAIKVATR